MKKIILLIICLWIATIGLLKAQPIWNRTIGFSNDSGSYVSAVKVLVDNVGQIYVLSNYQNPVGVVWPDRKILLRKFDENGGLLWAYTYDNQGNNNVRSFDLCIDNSNNAYIAGGRFDSIGNTVMVVKVNASGGFEWDHYGNTGFNTDWYTTILYRNNLFYVRAAAGVVVYDQNGTEQYVIDQYNTAFDVDYSGRVVLAAYITTNNIVRYNSSGSVDIIDSTIMADKIVCTYNNEIYVSSGQMGMTPYQVVKHDSNGQLQWSLPGLPITPAFGDISYGILNTGFNEMVIFGVGDSIIKFNDQGQIIWKKNITGMDDYLITGKILGNGFILLSGTLNGFAGSDINTKIFNINGDEIWSQLYSGTLSGSEFGVDIDISLDGIYVLSQLNDSSHLFKYANPAVQTNVDFSQVCVDSVWIDSSGYVHVSIFNGNFVHMNYPGVTIVSANNDTVSLANINFFAQLGNSYQEYINTITDTTISDFSTYTFFMDNAFNPDTIAQISFCTPTGIIQRENDIQVSLYPIPAHDQFYIRIHDNSSINELKISDLTGKTVLTRINPINGESIACSDLANGLYLVTLNTSEQILQVKILITH